MGILIVIQNLDNPIFIFYLLRFKSDSNVYNINVHYNCLKVYCQGFSYLAFGVMRDMVDVIESGILMF